MHPDATAAILGSLVASMFGLVFVVGLFITIFAFPFMALSATRSLRTIAREIERANDYRQHSEHGKPWTPVGL